MLPDKVLEVPVVDDGLQVVQDTYQEPARLKKWINELAIKLNQTRFVKAEGGLTGKRAPVIVALLLYAKAHEADFLEWYAKSLSGALAEIRGLTKAAE